MRFILLALAVGRAAPPLGVTVSPARLSVTAPASRTVSVRNVGSAPVVVTAERRRVDWLQIRPSRFTLGAGSRAVLTVRASRRRRTAPGDHQQRVVLIARPIGRGRIAIRMRLGIRLRVRMPGRLVRRLALGAVRVRRHKAARVLIVGVVNRGNVEEQLRGRLSVRLLRSHRVISRLTLRRSHEVGPGRRTIVRLRYAGRVRGRVTAVVAVPPVERRYRLRL